MNANTLNPAQNHKQVLPNLLKETYQNITDDTQRALHNIVTISYAAAVHGRYQEEICHTAYQQLMNWECQITDDNLNQFAHLLADLIDIAIENIRIINYGVLGSPFYRDLFFDAIEQALPKTPEANCFLDDLLYQFNRGWEKLPTKRHPLADLWIKPILNTPAY